MYFLKCNARSQQTVQTIWKSELSPFFLSCFSLLLSLLLIPNCGCHSMCLKIFSPFTKVYFHFFVCFIQMASCILCCNLLFPRNIFYVSLILFKLSLNLWGPKAGFNLFSRRFSSTALQPLEPFRCASFSDHSIPLLALKHSEVFWAVCPPFQTSVFKCVK